MPEGHVFISYSRNDGNDHASKLESALKARNFAVWRDIRNIRPELDFTADIETGIENASHVVVCITKDAKRNNSYVRREIGYALYFGVPVIPLRFEDIPPHISIFNNEWVDFFKDWDAAYARTCSILGGEPYVNRPASGYDDPFKPYLQYLLGRVTDCLRRAVIRKIDQEVEDTPDAVPEQVRQKDIFDQLFAGLPIGEETKPEIPFHLFAEGFKRYMGRVLLLGEPGAGKTITLMAHARDAIVARLDNPNLPLPLFGLVATWNAQNRPSLSQWLAQTYPNLLTESAVDDILKQGNGLLLLDGLDELGGIREDEQTKERYDPRLRFIRHIPANNQVLVTCRIKDYEELGTKIPLNGAMTLKPLADNQMQIYLRDYPELWNLLQNEPTLREIASTPLLLSRFALGLQDISETERMQIDNLHDSGDLRDKIFELYLKNRYIHEANKLRSNLPFTLNDIYEVLGWVAMVDATLFGDANLIPAQNLENVLQQPHVTSFIELALNLDVLLATESLHYRFTHLLLRDYFAYSYSVRHLRDKSFYNKPIVFFSPARCLARLDDKRVLKHLVDVLQEPTENEHVRSGMAAALGLLGDKRAVELLLIALFDDSKLVQSSAVFAFWHLNDLRAVKPLTYLVLDPELYIYHHQETGFHEWFHTPARVLGKLGDTRAVEPLIRALLNNGKEDGHFSMVNDAAEALGILKDIRAVKPLISRLGRNYGLGDASIAAALGDLGDRRAVAPLIRILSDHHPLTRMMAAISLGELGDSRAVEPLINLLLDKDRDVRYHTVEALARLGDVRAVEPIIAYLNNEDWDIRRVCISALGSLEDTRAVTPLISLLKDTSRKSEFTKRICDYAAEALERIGTQETLAAVATWRQEQRGGSA